MTKPIAELVVAIDAMRPRPQKVTAEEFAAITCNRCGACCEAILAAESPAEMAAAAMDTTRQPDERLFAATLVPVRRVPQGWQYRCRHFTRDTNGLGTCGIYAHRPAECRAFPRGPVRRFPECAWYVEVSG